MLYFCTKCNSQGVDSLLLCAQELNNLFFLQHVIITDGKWHKRKGIDIERYRCSSAVKMRIASYRQMINKAALSNCQYIANKEVP